MEDQLKLYMQAVKDVLTEYGQYKTPWSEAELIFDDERMRYLVMRIGWFQQKRVHQCMVHVDIDGDRVVIQANNTEHRIRTDLMERGVPADKIQLGFLPPEVQITTTYPMWTPYNTPPETVEALASLLPEGVSSD